MDGTDNERTELCGQVLDGRYRIVRRIAVGGTGVVFEAVTARGGAAVAIKTLRDCFVNHIDLGTRLRRELEVSRRVVHPGVVRFIDQGTLLDGSPYLVMPLLTGESLAALLSRVGSLPPWQLVAIAARVASILHSVHVAGYVHRDVKPEHILLSRSAKGELGVQLLDFGVCASVDAPDDERRREAGRVFGTPSYVSPEQAAGEIDVDARADLFALGIVMFEALCGRLPFSAGSVSKLLLRIIRDDAPRLSELMSGIDPGLEQIVARLLARERGLRTPSARALSRALLPFTSQRYALERLLAASLRQPAGAGDVHTTVRGPAPTAARSAVA